MSEPPSESPSAVDGSSEPSDARLVAAALGGSEDAYRSLVLRYQRGVVALVGRMVRDRALAEDLAQDAFVRAFNNLHRYDPGRGFKSWLFKIAHHRAIDHLRLKRPIHVDLKAASPGGDESWDVLAAPEEEGPDRRAEAGELRRAVEASIAALRPNYRDVLLLRFQGGLAYEEIAEVSGISVSNVKVLLHRARKQLAAEIRQRGFAAPEAF